MSPLLLLLAACTGPSDSAVDTSDSAAEVFADDMGMADSCQLDVATPGDFPTPPQSFFQLPTSNGYVSATWVSERDGVPMHQLDTLTDHLPRQPHPEAFTRDLLHDLYVGVRVGDEAMWLQGVAPQSTRYVPGTGMIEVTWQQLGATVQLILFAPFQAGGEHDLVVRASVQRDGATGDISLYTLHNVQMGGSDGETVTRSADAITETRGGDAMRHTAIGTPSAVAAAPAGSADNPWVLLNAGSDLSDAIVSGDDVAVGFQWDLGSADSLQRGLMLSWGTDASALSSRVDSFIDGRDIAAIEQAELDDWAAYHAVEPTWQLDAPHDALVPASTAVLRMGQVREPGPGYGQILASLPPGGWNMSWPRDAAYAIVGLVRTDHQAEARAALDFMINADAGHYADYLPGVDDYLISITRYYGDGTEETDDAFCPDGSNAGPNIEYDDFGLFLWAYGEYHQRWPDDPWLAETRPAVLTGVADVLVALIDPNNGLLLPDSSIWERHWEECFPNGRKQFAYSSIQGAAGLYLAADMSGDDSYRDAADRIVGGLLTWADEGGPVLERDGCPALASAPEETCDGCGPWDGSVIELVNHDLVRPQSALAKGTLTQLTRNLAMDNGSPGYLRNDDGTGSTNPYPWYDDQEWVVIDLRMAAALAKVGAATGDPTATAQARLIVDWVGAQAEANHLLIAELLSDGVYQPEDDFDGVHPGSDLGSEYQGSVPMCGFGPGAYILALEALDEAS